MTAHGDHQDFDLDVLLGPARSTEPPAPPPSRPVPTPDRAVGLLDIAPLPARRSPEPERGAAAWFAMLGRHRRVAGTVFLLVVAIGVIVTLAATPLYEARTRIQLEPQARRVLPFKSLDQGERELARSFRRPGETMVAIRQLVRPREVARRTLDDLNLWDAMAASAAPVEDERMPSGLRGSRGRAMRAMLRGLRISAVSRSRLVDFRFRAADPALARRVADGLAASFIALAGETQAGKARDAAAWLDGQVAQLQTQVGAAEAALQQYRERHGAVATRPAGSFAQRLMDLSGAATDARTTRIEKEVLYRQLTSGATALTASDVNPALFDAVLQRQRAELETLDREEAELAAKLGDRHPDLVALRAAIERAEADVDAGLARVMERARAEYEVARAQEREIEGALARQRADALAGDRAGIELRLLQSDVEAARRTYNQVLRRRDELRVAEELSAAAMRVIDPAETPRRPVYPIVWLNLLLGVTLGFVAAHGVAVALDSWRRTRCTPEDLQKHLRVAVLGTLPRRSSETRARLSAEDAFGPFGEALNTLRTNVRFAVPDGRRVIVVTSGEPGEGKSTVTAHLGAALARDGNRVLIIDADMRRPVLHELFGAPSSSGLSQVLAGLMPREDAIVETGESGLSILPAGPVPPNPSELLLSPGYRDLVQTLAAEFDWVLIDAPPVLAVTDPVVLAQSASGFVFVVDGRVRNMRRLGFAFEQVRRAQTMVVGAVVNRAA